MELLATGGLLVAAFFVWGISMMSVLWPINDKPTSKGQWITAFIVTFAIVITCVFVIK